jgi:hypothetical protein
MPREKSPAIPTVRKRAPRKTITAPTGEGKPTLTRFVGPEHRAALIAEAAFFRAEQRGFDPGREVEDWLAAESEVDARLMSAKSGPRV